MVDEFLRKVREIELDRHFLDVPSKGVDFLPEEKGKIKVKVGDAYQEFTYVPKDRRLYSITCARARQ